MGADGGGVSVEGSRWVGEWVCVLGGGGVLNPVVGTFACEEEGGGGWEKGW